MSVKPRSALAAACLDSLKFREALHPRRAEVEALRVKLRAHGWTENLPPIGPARPKTTLPVTDGTR